MSGEERREFTRHVLGIVHDWPIVDETKLGQLVGRVEWMPEEDQARIWRRVTEWGDTQGDDRARAVLREHIRRFALTRFGRRRGLATATIDSARCAFKSLKPRDVAIRHEWLFAGQWIEPSADDIESENLSHSSRQAGIGDQRSAAMSEIWRTRGHEGVTALLGGKTKGDVVGRALASAISDPNSIAAFFGQCLEASGDLVGELDACMRGVLENMGGEELGRLLSAAAQEADPGRTARFLRCAPFRQYTWSLVAQSGQQVEDLYWRDVIPRWEHHTESEVTELINHLLGAKRPRAAFGVANRDWSLVETSQLERLLFAVATTKPGPSDQYKLDAYDICEALESLDGRTGVNPDDMATLEFLYSDVLEDGGHGVPNLEKQMASSPALFFRALTLAYRRRDRGQDPPEWRIDDRERAATIGSKALRLLGRVKQLPGMGEDGVVDSQVLFDWVDEVRRLCAEHDRVAIGDETIGEFLSRVDPVSDDVPWPRAEVCMALERAAARHIGAGFCTGVYNARGVHYRGEDGAPERRLSARFQRLARQHTFEYPFVASLLEEIAKDYDREAKWHDTEGEVRKRLE